MEPIYIVLIVVGIIILFIILSKLFRRKRWIYEKTTETPEGKSKVFLVDGVKHIFNSLNEAEDYARSMR